MKKSVIITAIALGFLYSCGCSKSSASVEQPSANFETDPNTFCFYYNWYGLQETDGKIYHWRHNILSDGGSSGDLGTIPGIRNNIATNYFPESGIYSSKDRATIRRHMNEMASAGIGVVALTWWKNSDIGQSSIPTLFEEAERAGIKVCFHIEPYEGRTAESVKMDIKGLINQFGAYKSFYRIDGRPIFFIYDSYMISQDDWARVLTPDGENTLRGTEYDSIVIGLLLNKNDRYSIKVSGFDGAYTYFATTGFTEGSTPTNWSELQKWFASQKMFFIPSVGPGYIDTRIRPWNGRNTRDREHGKYYENMWNGAINSGANYVAITSFNEWHEGAQIEPAVPKVSDDGSFTYLDYTPQSPDFYLTETKRHITNFVSHRK